METIDISIPTDWLPEQRPSPAELREAIRIGLTHLRRQQTEQHRHRDRVQQLLIEAGLAQPQPESRTVVPLTPEERLNLAKRAAAGGPLSELIMADRADRI